MNKGIIAWIALILTLIGTVNWGLVGLFKVDLVEVILGVNVIADIIYVLVALSGILVFVKAVK